MKKGTVMIVIILAVITLGSVCSASDKNSYVVKQTFTFNLVPNPTSVDGLPWGPWDGSGTGQVFCDNNDFVTGCSYSLRRYPGYTNLSDYSFLNVMPIGCTPSLQEELGGPAVDGEAVCKGCRVALTINHPGPPLSPDSPTDGEFRVYTYCGRPAKK
jgi:hypothetical protein